MKATQIHEFQKRVLDVLEMAHELYSIGDLMYTEIRFDLKGQCAGQAMIQGSRLILRFNQEAMEKDWDDMFNDTIPHEVAHLVCFKRPELGRNHNRGWKEVCRSLGGAGDRCHKIELSPGKKLTRFLYVLEDGTEVKLTKNAHTKVQNNPGQLFMRAAHTKSRKRIDLHPHHFVKKMIIK
jgi:SprT protein